MFIAVPAKISSHPYLKLLYEHLKKQHLYIVSFDNMADFIMNFLRCQIIHLHWIEYYIRSKRKILSLLKFFVYLASLIIFKFPMRKKIVVTLHNIIPHEKISQRLEFLGFMLTLKLADKIIVHNNYSLRVASNLYDIPSKKFYVIPHGNFIGYYQNNLTKESARNMLKIPLHAFAILYLGHIRDYKGVEKLIEVFHELLKIRKDLYLIICGLPHNSKVIRLLQDFYNEFKEQVMLRLGYIPDKEIQVYMNAADIGIIPYERVTTPGSLILFMSFQKPVIVPRLRPIIEILEEDGLYYLPGHNKNLSEVILRVMELGHYDLYAFSKKLFEKVKKYDWKDIALLTKRLYFELCKKLD